MGVTKAIPGGAVWGINRTVQPGVVVTQPGSMAVQSNYPLANLANANRNLEARLTWSDTGTAYPRVDLGAA